jgi:hypothetical protein
MTLIKICSGYNKDKKCYWVPMNKQVAEEGTAALKGF